MSLIVIVTVPTGFASLICTFSFRIYAWILSRFFNIKYLLTLNCQYVSYVTLTSFFDDFGAYYTTHSNDLAPNLNSRNFAIRILREMEGLPLRKIWWNMLKWFEGKMSVKSVENSVKLQYHFNFAYFDWFSWTYQI